jgi:hypothetical protein
MLTAPEIHRMSRRELRALLAAGHPFDASELAGEYLGTSLGLPRFVEKLTWKNFKKVFRRDEAGLAGWNVRLRDNHVFGHFRVVPHAPGVLLDYGAVDGGGALKVVRDPLVAVNPGSSALLLGWTYLQIGRFSVGTPSYFTLERAA